MSGPTFLFVGYALLIAALLAASDSLRWRQSVMLVASAVFLATFSHSIVAFLPFAVYLLVGFAAVRAIATNERRPLYPAIVGVLLLFFWLKKYAFVPSGLWLAFPYVTIGLSYVLFRLLLLIIEVRGDPAIAAMSLSTYLAYLVGFNTLVAGPIQSFEEYAAQQLTTHPRPVSWTDAGEAAERIITGLLKTNVLAAILSHWRDIALAHLTVGPRAASLADAALTFAI